MAGRSRLDAPWLAIYTSSRHEKIVAKQLGLRSIECFLPLYTARRNWNGRRAVVEMPLFPGYLFARVNPESRLRVLNILGVVRVVGFGGHAAILGEEEIEAVRAAVTTCRAEPSPWITAGRRVRVRSGPLEGLEGVVVRRKNSLRVVILLTVIMRAMSVEIDELELEPVSRPGWREREVL
jgi:transcription antitermination factor NusG